MFITHHHSDHNAEFGLLLYNSWATGLNHPIDAYGPAGLKQLTSGFWQAYQFDIETRMADEGRPDLRKLVNVHEYTEGPVMSAGNLKVTALRNQHPPITDSFALKFEFPGKTIVFSGDTAYFPPLAAFAKGADILIHEVMYAPALEELLGRNPNAKTLMSHLQASHDTGITAPLMSAASRPRPASRNSCSITSSPPTPPASLSRPGPMQCARPSTARSPSATT